ncbi:hypothetical protein ACRAWD_26860 [Caulobacter segnis]
MVTRLASEKTFAWRAVIGTATIFAGEHIFELEATEAGTRLIHREEFSGFDHAVAPASAADGDPPRLRGDERRSGAARARPSA